MKKILILVDKLNERHKLVRDFLEENLSDSVEVSLKHFSTISFYLGKDKVSCFCDGISLEEFNLVYFRRGGARYIQLEGTIALFLRSKNITFIDKAFKELGASGNKLYNLTKLALNSLSIVPSFYVSRENLIKFSKEAVNDFGLPIFVKSLIKQRREGIFVLDRVEDAKKVLKLDSSEGFLIQPKVEIAKEYRAVVMGNKVVALHLESPRKVKNRRIVVDSKESVGGWVGSDELSKNIQEEIIKASQTLELNISGADVGIAKNSDDFYIFEVNRGPGLTLDPNISPELPELSKYFQKLIS